MNIWSQAPFLRIIIPFICGILCYSFNLPFHIFTVSIILLLSSLIILSAQFIFSAKLFSYKNQAFFGWVFFFAFLSSGLLLSYNNDSKNKIDFIGNIKSEKSQKIIAEINNAPVKGNNYYKTTCKVLSVQNDKGNWETASGKILLYLEKNDSTLPPKYGNIIALNSYLQTIQKPLFNSDFNYKQYLANKNIYYQSFVQSTSWSVLEKKNGNPILNISLHLREKLISTLKEQLGDGDEYAVLAAMLAGYRSDLSADMLNAYSGAGAMHIMSVSGLHVGVIYILLSFIFSLIPYLRKKLIAKVIFVLLSIWIFAFITGLSASVLRAAVMLSFIVAGECIGRRINSFNSLAAAAFFLLLFNPNMIFEIGFQLSFSAVAGILLIYKPIYKLFYFKKSFFDKIWQLMSISIAAQIATLPLTLYYFGQFPVYFLLSNILIVPLSGIVIYMGIATVSFSQIPGLNNVVSWIMGQSAWIMNKIVYTIESLPGAVIQNINLSGIASIILMIITILLMIMLIRKKIRLLYPLLGLIIFFTIAQKYAKNRMQNEEFLLIVKDASEYIYAFKTENNFYVFVPTSIHYSPSSFILNRTRKYIDKNKLKLIPVTETFMDDNVFAYSSFRQIRELRLMVWDKEKNPSSKEYLPETDLAITTNNNYFLSKKFIDDIPAKYKIGLWSSSSKQNKGLKSKREWKINF